jgi:hypothetical protein
MLFYKIPLILPKNIYSDFTTALKKSISPLKWDAKAKL